MPRNRANSLRPCERCGKPAQREHCGRCRAGAAVRTGKPRGGGGARARVVSLAPPDRIAEFAARATLGLPLFPAPEDET